jgi:hypothetical protein
MQRKVPARRVSSSRPVVPAAARNRRLRDAVSHAAVEGLENRQLFSVFTVSNVADAIQGTPAREPLDLESEMRDAAPKRSEPHPSFGQRCGRTATYRLPTICRLTMSRMISFVPP